MQQEQEIFRNYGFILELQGERAGYFTKISGMGMEVECLEYREGGSPLAVRKLPGQISISPIKCEWGVTNSRAMWDWLMTAASGIVDRKQISVVVLGSDGVTEKARWNYTNAWPSKWDGAEFDSSGNNIAIERMVIQAESVERAQDVQAAVAEE